MVFSSHTIEFTKKTMQMSADQIMNMHVPTFRDSRCQYSGMIESRIAIPEKTEYVVLAAVISALEKTAQRKR